MAASFRIFKPRDLRHWSGSLRLEGEPRRGDARLFVIALRNNKGFRNDHKRSRALPLPVSRHRRDMSDTEYAGRTDDLARLTEEMTGRLQKGDSESCSVTSNPEDSRMSDVETERFYSRRQTKKVANQMYSLLSACSLAYLLVCPLDCLSWMAARLLEPQTLITSYKICRCLNDGNGGDDGVDEPSGTRSEHGWKEHDDTRTWR